VTANPDKIDNWTWTIGHVVATFGRHGEVRARILTDFPERFRELRRVCVRPPKGPARIYDVEATRFHRGCVLLKLAGVESIDDGELLRNADVQVRRDDAVPLEAGSFYNADLIGLQVVTKQGRVIGPIEDVLNYPGQDLMKIGDVLIPMVRQIVVSVDMDARRVVVDPPIGLLPDEEPGDAD